MSNYFDANKMMEVLKDYYTVTHIRIAILDTYYRDILGYPNKKAALCEYIRESKLADEQCRECDRKACQTARNTGSAYMYQCHAGLYEIIQPLSVNGIIVGYLFFAHMLSGENHESCLKEILERTKKFELNSEIIKKFVNESTLLKQDYIKSASRLLETIATHICMEKMGLFKQFGNLPLEINKFIISHIEEEISINDICFSLGIGKTKLCNVSKQYFKLGIHEHIRKIRIEKAKEILINEPEVLIDEVAQRCGFSDYNYFIYIFRKTTGITPKRFIKRHEIDESNILPLSE